MEMAISLVPSSVGGWHSGQVRVLLMAPGKEAGDEIKRHGYVREEGESKQANQKISNCENISYQALLRLLTEY